MARRPRVAQVPGTRGRAVASALQCSRAMSPDSAQPTRSSPPARVLVVDDDPTIRAGLRDLLALHGL